MLPHMPLALKSWINYHFLFWKYFLINIQIDYQHSETFKTHATAANISSGFRKTGLFPFNPNAPDYEKCAAVHTFSYGPAKVYAGVNIDGKTEMATQCEPPFHPSRSSQTEPTISILSSTLTALCQKYLPSDKTWGDESVPVYNLWKELHQLGKYLHSFKISF